MSHAAYNELWRDGIRQLNAALAAEHGPLSAKLKPADVFSHFALVYLGYLRALRLLEEAYDGLVHPQKRRALKRTLEATMGRVVELRNTLRLMPDLRRHSEAHQDWVFLDDFLEDLKLTPEVFDLTIPAYFTHERREELRERHAMHELLARQYDVPVFAPADDRDPDGLLPGSVTAAGGYGYGGGGGGGAGAEAMTLAMAIRIIQCNERGRQGRERARFMREIRSQEERERAGEPEADPTHAARQIQRVVRGHLARVRARALREDELVFIGMEPRPFDPTKDRDPRAEARAGREDRRLRQVEYEREYQEAVVKIRERLAEQDGPRLRDAIADRAREWWTAYREHTGKFPEFPDEEDGGSAQVERMPLPREPDEEELKRLKAKAKAKGKGKGAAAAAAAAKKKKAAAAAAAAKKKKKAGGGDDDDEDVVLPVSQFTEALQRGIEEYTTHWAAADEGENPLQRHDPALIRDALAPDVEKEVRRDIDKVLRQELENLKAALRKRKGKARRKKKKKKKGGKKKKARRDPTASRPMEAIYAELVHAGILQRVPETRLADFVGEYNLLGETLRDGDVFADPSPAVVRQIMTEAVILPLGSQYVHETVPLLKSMLLYGPRGSGKTHVARAVATEVGATFINLSPAITAGKYTGLRQTSLMVHMAFKVARVLAPSVVYIDDVEKVFAGKKKSDPHASARIKKDLKKEVKALTREDRVIVIGCSRTPQDACKKRAAERGFRGFFQRTLHLARPDYGNRRVLARHFVQARSPTGAPVPLTEAFDLGALAHITDGYTAGGILRAVRMALGARRLETVARRPLATAEFVPAFAAVDPVFRSEDAELRKFAAKGMPKKIVEDEDAKKKKKKKTAGRR
jgi:SpoVK/Ycf46/Vps4 family AAA+-type ATPase